MPIEIVQIQIPPEKRDDDAFIQKQLSKKLKRKPSDFDFRWRKRSIDARQRTIRLQCAFEIKAKNETWPTPQFYSPKSLGSKTVHIIGAGPAGLFAALRAIELGIRPVVIERGKDVRSRRRDLAKLNKEQIVNPDSNYCFGEGGAGTYSDGKLYTRSKKRGDVEKVLGMFVKFGADQDIRIDTHPHIGTNKLPQIIVAMRDEIIARGGEVRFEEKLTDFKIENSQITALEINADRWESCEEVILATGHSARDIFYMLDQKGLELQAKSFALGVRVEHRQEFIDELQYHGRHNDEYLPPASYSLVAQANGKGVFSFCMCPGGIIAPCATEPGEVVTNGWSPSKRNNPYSNSGIVVSVEPEDLKSKGPFACLEFQQQVEKDCWEAAGKTQQVPAQCLQDFIENRKSTSFPRSSYQPGIVSVNLREVLPEFIANRLVEGFKAFDLKMPGFITNDAVVHAPESRTSSPVQIPRDSENGHHPQVKNLFPSAEGAGYAGGIVSAAIDGMKCVDWILKKD